MKKLFIIFSFISLTVSQLQAQTFEIFYKKAIEDFKKSPKTYIQKTCTPDFIFVTGHSGEFRNFDQTLAMFSEDKGNPNYQNEITKIMESGDIAVVAGISTNPQPNMIYKDVYTYTFRKINSEWKWVMAHHTKIDYKSLGISDENAIKQTCENETKYYHEADVNNWNNQWSEKARSEYQSQFLKELIKIPFAKGEILLGLKNNVSKTMKPDGLVSKITDFETRINGNIAWATYTQEDFNGETSVLKNRELRILEKVNDSWKIVCLSIQRM
jgi:ketosteroid isomerase-like protein